MESEKPHTSQAFAPLNPKLALRLAAPHTWPAAIMPVLLALCLAAAKGAQIPALLTCALLFICLLMQSAVNTFNDYYDYVKGADSVENQADPTDAVLVYNPINPHSVLKLAISFILAAFLLGSYVVFMAGWIPLAIGLIGAAIIVLYSAGKTPLSYLPLGEFISGLAMGVLIPFACYYSYVQEFSWLVCLFSLPLFLGIALIMLTNNSCDIEKDTEAKRCTLAVLLGRDRVRTLYRFLMVFWILAIVGLVGFFFTPGLLVVLFMLIAVYPGFFALFKNPFDYMHRAQAMAGCLNLNIMLGAFYCLAIVFSLF